MSLFRRKKVPLNNDTINKCKCMQCPVQVASACAIGKNQKLILENKMSPQGRPAETSSQETGGIAGSIAGMLVMQSSPQAAMPAPEELPGVYCSSGKANCSDIDRAKNCIFSTCQVYKDYALLNAKPIEQYCFNDRAQ